MSSPRRRPSGDGATSADEDDHSHSDSESSTSVTASQHAAGYDAVAVASTTPEASDNTNLEPPKRILAPRAVLLHMPVEQRGGSGGEDDAAGSAADDTGSESGDDSSAHPSAFTQSAPITPYAHGRSMSQGNAFHTRADGPSLAPLHSLVSTRSPFLPPTHSAQPQATQHPDQTHLFPSLTLLQQAAIRDHTSASTPNSPPNAGGNPRATAASNTRSPAAAGTPMSPPRRVQQPLRPPLGRSSSQPWVAGTASEPEEIRPRLTHAASTLHPHRQLHQQRRASGHGHAQSVQMTAEAVHAMRKKASRASTHAIASRRLGNDPSRMHLPRLPRDAHDVRSRSRSPAVPTDRLDRASTYTSSHPASSAHPSAQPSTQPSAQATSNDGSHPPTPRRAPSLPHSRRGSATDLSLPLDDVGGQAPTMPVTYLDQLSASFVGRIPESLQHPTRILAPGSILTEPMIDPAMTRGADSPATGSRQLSLAEMAENARQLKKQLRREAGSPGAARRILMGLPAQERSRANSVVSPSSLQMQLPPTHPTHSQQVQQQQAHAVPSLLDVTSPNLDSIKVAIATGDQPPSAVRSSRPQSVRQQSNLRSQQHSRAPYTASSQYRSPHPGVDDFFSPAVGGDDASSQQSSRQVSRQISRQASRMQSRHTSPPAQTRDAPFSAQNASSYAAPGSARSAMMRQSSGDDEFRALSPLHLGDNQTSVPPYSSVPSPSGDYDGSQPVEPQTMNQQQQESPFPNWQRGASEPQSDEGRTEWMYDPYDHSSDAGDGEYGQAEDQVVDDGQYYQPDDVDPNEEVDDDEDDRGGGYRHPYQRNSELEMNADAIEDACHDDGQVERGLGTDPVAWQEKDEERVVQIFIEEMGAALFSCGLPMHVVEFYLVLVAQRLRCDITLVAINTHFWISFNPSSTAHMIVAKKPSLSLSRMVDVCGVSEYMLHGMCSPVEGLAQLQAIARKKPAYPKWMLVPTMVCTCLFYAPLFNCGWTECGVAALSGLFIGLLDYFTASWTSITRGHDLIVGIISAVFAVLCDSYVRKINLLAAVFGGIVWFLPGLRITLSMLDLSTGNSVTGSAKFLSSIITAMNLGIGVVAGMTLGQATGIGDESDILNSTSYGTTPEWFLAICIVAVTFPCIILLDAKLSHTPQYIFGSAMAYYLSSYCTLYIGQAFGSWIAAVAVGLVGNIYGRLTQYPAIEFILFGILMLVPGSIGVRGILAGSALTTVTFLSQMLTVAIAIVTGLFTANVVLPPLRAL